MKKHHYSRREESSSAPKSYEFRFLNRSGSIRDILLTIDMIPKSKKSVAALLDITELKQNGNKIRKSEKMLREQNIKLKKLDKLKTILLQLWLMN